MKIIVNGVNGRMGAEVVKLLKAEYHGAGIAAGADISPKGGDGFPVYGSLFDYDGQADCIVDFSHYSATPALLEYAVKRKLPLVIATTGHTKRELCEIEKASLEVPIFFSANMSLGIALLASLAVTAAKTMPGANIEIVEKHHNRKLDVPSGTALLIANEIKKARPEHELLTGRHENGKRPEKEIGIHSLRLGNIVGEHEVIIATDSQVITLKHEAQSRSLFAEGAIDAAFYIRDKKPGIYDMKTMIKGR